MGAFGSRGNGASGFGGAAACRSLERRLWRVDAAAGRERVRVDSGEVATSRDAKVREEAEARTAEPAVSVDLDGEGRRVGGAARRRDRKSVV